MQLVSPAQFLMQWISVHSVLSAPPFVYYNLNQLIADRVAGEYSVITGLLCPVASLQFQ